MYARGCKCRWIWLNLSSFARHDIGRLAAFSIELMGLRHDFGVSGVRGLSESSEGDTLSVSEAESGSEAVSSPNDSGCGSDWYNIFMASLQFFMFFSCINVMTSLTAALLKSGKSDFSHHSTDSNPAAMYSGREGMSTTLTDVWKRTDRGGLLLIFGSFGGLARVIVQNNWPIIELFCAGSVYILSTGGRCSTFA